MNIVKAANKKSKKQIPNLNLLTIENESMKVVCFKNNLKD